MNIQTRDNPVLCKKKLFNEHAGVVYIMHERNELLTQIATSEAVLKRVSHIVYRQCVLRFLENKQGEVKK